MRRGSAQPAGQSWPQLAHHRIVVFSKTAHSIDRITRHSRKNRRLVALAANELERGLV